MHQYHRRLDRRVRQPRGCPGRAQRPWTKCASRARGRLRASPVSIIRRSFAVRSGRWPGPWGLRW